MRECQERRRGRGPVPRGERGDGRSSPKKGSGAWECGTLDLRVPPWARVWRRTTPRLSGGEAQKQGRRLWGRAGVVKAGALGSQARPVAEGPGPAEDGPGPARRRRLGPRGGRRAAAASATARPKGRGGGSGGARRRSARRPALPRPVAPGDGRRPDGSRRPCPATEAQTAGDYPQPRARPLAAAPPVVPLVRLVEVASRRSVDGPLEPRGPGVVSGAAGRRGGKRASDRLRRALGREGPSLGRRRKSSCALEPGH